MAEAIALALTNFRGASRPRQLDDLRRRMTGKEASAGDAQAFERLSDRRRDRELASDPRLVGDWSFEVDDDGERRLSCAPGWVADVCGTSEEMIWRHYRKWTPSQKRDHGRRVAAVLCRRDDESGGEGGRGARFVSAWCPPSTPLDLHYEAPSVLTR